MAFIVFLLSFTLSSFAHQDHDAFKDVNLKNSSVCNKDIKDFCPHIKDPAAQIPCLEQFIDHGLSKDCNLFSKARMHHGKHELDEIIAICDRQFKLKCPRDPKGINLKNCYKIGKFEGECLKKLKETGKVK